MGGVACRQGGSGGSRQAGFANKVRLRRGEVRLRRIHNPIPGPVSESALSRCCQGVDRRYILERKDSYFEGKQGHDVHSDEGGGQGYILGPVQCFSKWIMESQ